MSSVESVRQKAISKLTRKYGKAYVRFIMNPRHSTNALIPQPVQLLTQRIQEADSVEELQGYEEAAEGILSGRIQPRQLAQVQRAGPEVGIRGGGRRKKVVPVADSRRSRARRTPQETIGYLEATVSKQDYEIATLNGEMRAMQEQFEQERAVMQKQFEEERAEMRKQMEEEKAAMQKRIEQ